MTMETRGIQMEHKNGHTQTVEHKVELIIEKLDRIQNLPTLPLVMQKISAAVRDPKSDASTVARLIEDDPAIMARILKVVNSALYAGDIRIESVHQAVARLGMNAVNNLALSTAVFSVFGEGDDGFDREAFWRHSISVGIAACVLYERAAPHLEKKQNKETLRLAGLLHDIGKIVMDRYLQDDFRQALQLAHVRSIPLYEAEHEVIGADHTRVGAWLGIKWNLAEELIQTIRWHHDPLSVPPEHWELNALCHVANFICNQQHIGDSGDLTDPVWTHAVWKKLGLSVSDIASVVDEVNEESAKSEILLALSK